MNNYLLVAAGGAAGAMARYFLVSVSASWSIALPLGTLLVNVLGSFAIGGFSGWLLAGNTDHGAARVLFQSGFLGAFTTFSAFSLDTLTLYAAGSWRAAALNVGLNVGLCLLSVAVGVALGGALRGSSG